MLGQLLSLDQLSHLSHKTVKENKYKIYQSYGGITTGDFQTLKFLRTNCLAQLQPDSQNCFTMLKTRYYHNVNDVRYNVLNTFKN